MEPMPVIWFQVLLLNHLHTRSEELKRYFKAMMWYGRLTMLIKGHENYGPAAHQPALVSSQEAQIQTILGSAIAGLLAELKIGTRRSAKVWERMYKVTAYYVGLADDLTPQDYRKALRKVFGNVFKIIHSLGDAHYRDYDKRIQELKKEFSAISNMDWNRNLYWSWLYALKGLTEPVQGDGWPTFLTTHAWLDKQINAALGSWSSLRHDTILYAKQSYTPTITRESAEPYREQHKLVVGYVEPVPKFYARLVALTRMSRKGLSDLTDEKWREMFLSGKEPPLPEWTKSFAFL